MSNISSFDSPEHVQRLASFSDFLQLDILLAEEAGHVNFALRRLEDRFRKRFNISNVATHEKAILDFLEINDQALRTVPVLSADIISHARDFIYTGLESFTRLNSNAPAGTTLCFEALIARWRFGPGSSNGVRGSHFAEKLGAPWTVTAKCAKYHDFVRFYTPRLRLYDEKHGKVKPKIVAGSRLTTVPKNEKTARTICVEPLVNMALQLAAESYLSGVLKHIGVDLQNQQDRNRHLAYLGSIDGSLATIDLKSASDLITPQLIASLWPPEWYHFLTSIRSDYISLEHGVSEIGPFTVRAGMMSPMGNGSTFPVMTLTLLALVYATSEVGRCGVNKKRCTVDYSKCGVFGDDIIIPTEMYSATCETLRAAGLVINHEKSFSGRNFLFRESCGGDFYHGRNVTPFYIESLRNDAEIYVAINKIVAWCEEQVCMLPTCLSYLTSLLSTPVNVVPHDQRFSADYSGFLSRSHFQATWHKYDVVSRRVKLNNLDLPDDLVMLCLLGGYVNDMDGTLFYIPRRDDVKYRIRKEQWPKGYCRGRSDDDIARSVNKILENFLVKKTLK